MQPDQPVEILAKPSKSKAKERDPVDFAARMIAFQRRNASATRPRERADRSPAPVPSRPPTTTPPSISTSRPLAISPRKLPPSHQEADPEDFSRRLKISSPGTRIAQNSKPHHHAKLFNPDTDPIPMRHSAEPECVSDATSSSYAPRGTPGGTAHHQRDLPPRQLFDHRKDDPVRFAVFARPNGRPTPTPKSSGEYISASSTSSYANSVTSSNFTLSSNTTDSSASSALFEGNGRPKEEASNNVFALQLKRLYRRIAELEEKVKQEDTDGDVEEGRIMLKGKEIEDEDLEKEKWKKLIANHKLLAESMQNLLEISLAPSVPASLRNIPTKYNIIIRLWTYAFHKLLESLRRASFSSVLALEHLQDFIYYAYTFYTGLLEEQTLSEFKGGWLEALGDLARYRMAVAAMVTGSIGNGTALTTDVMRRAAAVLSADPTDSGDPAPIGPKPPPSPKSVSDAPAARIDDSPSPSVGLAAARLLDVEPEKERWRVIAREWYGAGLQDTPGTGKLHHHLGLLSREAEGEELKGVYHFVKSMITLHPFMTSRESVLPLWSVPAQAQRMLPDTSVPNLFVLLHGMLFTHIQLDDFQPTLGRFIERLEIEGAQEREWIMMAVVNIGAVLEYGKPCGILKKAGGVGGRENPAAAGVRLMAKRGLVDEEHMDVDGDTVSPAMSEATSSIVEYPLPFKLALELTFAMFTHVLRNPTRKASQFARLTLNPYLTVLSTFLATVLKNPTTLEVLEPTVPWEEMAGFLGTIPRNVLAAQGLGLGNSSHSHEQMQRWAMLTSGCAPPLSEDWCLRGMEWVGRRVYERGFWKSEAERKSESKKEHERGPCNGGEERRSEIEVLDKSEGDDGTDGIIEDEDSKEDKGIGGGEVVRRWVRVVRCAVDIAGVVDGFRRVEGTREWVVEGPLHVKVQQWREADRIAREEEEKRRVGARWADESMDVDEGGVDDEISEESEDDEDDTDEIKALKARRRYLQSLVQPTQRVPMSYSPSSRRPRHRAPHEQAATRPPLPIVAGYTVLVIDTNILLSSLMMLASLIESLRWTVVVPLPVVMELDGLSSTASRLGEAAQSAMSYLTSHIRSHSTSLKVQTSKGNYLTSLSVRAEHVDFGEGESRERNMDDLILKAAIWHDEHWVDRSAMLKSDDVLGDMEGAVKVVLLSLDRNLRLKARSRQLPAASEKDLASILATDT